MDEIKHLRFGTSWNEEHFDGALAFGNMRAEFEAAAAKYPAEVHESFYIFGGRSVRIRVVRRAHGSWIRWGIRQIFTIRMPLQLR
jgi:hypothetical protein